MVDTTLAGTRVFFGSYAAPITYTSGTQINCIVPYEMAGQSQTVVQVQYQGVTSAASTIPATVDAVRGAGDPAYAKGVDDLRLGLLSAACR
jgi:uncharacterized protein (TIGR03437 family)